MENNLNEKLIEIKDLSVAYVTEEATFKAVNHIDLELNPGETLGIVGETGAGKTTTALAIMRLLPERTGKITSGSIRFKGKELLDCSDAEMRAIRGIGISMIFQDPMTSLNPLIKVGDQVKEVLEIHSSEKKASGELDARVDELFTLVGIKPARKSDFPNQFSGGMKQRVVIAMALACEPDLILADEPTTALDVTIQAQVLNLMQELKEKIRTSMILITHDMGVVANCCDKVAIMYAGEIIESGSIEEIIGSQQHHPYTTGLFGSIPDLTTKSRRLSPIYGLMPDPAALPAGCKFHPRCSHCSDICKLQDPDIIHLNDQHSIKCHLFRTEEMK